MRKIEWERWREKKPVVNWIDHNKYLWFKWVYDFHNNWQKDTLWTAELFEESCTSIYVLLRKYQEIYECFGIEKTDQNTQQIEEFYSKLVYLYMKSGYNREKCDEKCSAYTHIPFSNIKSIDALRCEIEASKTILNLSSYAINIQTRNFFENSKVTSKEYLKDFKGYYEKKISYSKANDKPTYVHSGNARCKNKINSVIVNHCNRNITEELKKKEKEIIDLKKKYEAGLVKVTKDSKHLYLMKFEQYKKRGWFRQNQELIICTKYSTSQEPLISEKSMK